MKLVPVKILPGLHTLQTDRGEVGRWKDGDKVRFWRGMPEKIGGWQKSGSATFVGKARKGMDWLTLAVEKIIGLGTHLKLYVWKGAVFYDITPIRATSTINNNPFAMTSGSAVVTVTDTAHGAGEGDYVTYSGASAGAGITISGEYAITEVVDADTYKITHTANATSSASGGGASVVAAYQISVGAESSIANSGWSAGGYGTGTYGTPRSVTNFLTYARLWSLDNWGEDLIACPRGGGIYAWDASTGTGTRAAAISGGPATAKAIFVSDEDRHLVVLGAHDGSVSDPMLVRWSDTEDYTTFTATETNTAGDKRLDGGNELYTGIKVNGGRLILSDSFAWLMTFDGPPYTYGFRSLTANGGILSPNAVAEKDGRGYWMAKRGFKVYDGTVRDLPCDVLNHVYDDINDEQNLKVYAGVNQSFGEVWWLYPSAESTECDRYVLYNEPENLWSFGTIDRTVFVGDSKIFSSPYAAGTDGHLYNHETSVNADGVAMEAYLESGDLEISPGDSLMKVKGMVPDFKRLTGAVSVILKGKRYPQAAEQMESASEMVTSSTERISPSMRARQIAILVECNDADADFRMGEWRVELRAHGRR